MTAPAPDALWPGCDTIRAEMAAGAARPPDQLVKYIPVGELRSGPANSRLPRSVDGRQNAAGKEPWSFEYEGVSSAWP
jgi:hypothetical protein